MKKEKVRALLCNETEGDRLVPFNGKILLKDFNQDNYNVVDHEKFSEIFQQVLKSKVLEIGDQKVFALFFSDGQIWDTHVGWRPNHNGYLLASTEEWVNMTYKSY